jgi:hypothetical protein
MYDMARDYRTDQEAKDLRREEAMQARLEAGLQDPGFRV